MSEKSYGHFTVPSKRRKSAQNYLTFFLPTQVPGKYPTEALFTLQPRNGLANRYSGRAGSPGRNPTLTALNPAIKKSFHTRGPIFRPLPTAPLSLRNFCYSSQREMFVFFHTVTVLGVFFPQTQWPFSPTAIFRCLAHCRSIGSTTKRKKEEKELQFARVRYHGLKQFFFSRCLLRNIRDS